ncbi:hypothetical protein M3J09_010464 [Ascochyta lentis]
MRAITANLTSHKAPHHAVRAQLFSSLAATLVGHLARVPHTEHQRSTFVARFRGSHMTDLGSQVSTLRLPVATYRMRQLSIKTVDFLLG